MQAPVVIITGATGHLGSATAHAFRGAGVRTVLVDRSQEGLREGFISIAPAHQVP